MIPKAKLRDVALLEDPEYSREFALAGGWRAVLGVPLLRIIIVVAVLAVGPHVFCTH